MPENMDRFIHGLIWLETAAGEGAGLRRKKQGSR